MRCARGPARGLARVPERVSRNVYVYEYIYEYNYDLIVSPMSASARGCRSRSRQVAIRLSN